jgi:hypothetical protein
MWRWIKNSLVVLCGIVAITAGWVHWRSHRISSVGHYYGEKGWLGFYSAEGRLVLAVGREKIDSLVKRDFHERPIKRALDWEYYDVKWVGVGFKSRHSPRAYFLTLPLWMLWTAAAIPVLAGTWRRVKKHWRKSVHRCESCGYDLRASGERCPECGAEAQPGAVNYVYN